MTSKKPVVIYGASGYTGRLVAEYLREYRVPFIAAGRDGGRIREVLNKVPGIENADYEIAEVAHDTEALSALFKGAKVVCNTVGPFMKYGTEVVEACLAAGAHYTDTNGEQNWMLHAQAHWGDRFAGQHLVLAPGVAQMYTTGEIAANICLETPGLDTLDILVLWKGLPTYASTQTIFSILTADFYYLEQKEYVKWAPAAKAEVVVPGQHQTALALPWGGTAHPVWFKNDPRVANCKVMGGVFDRAVMDGVVALNQIIDEKIKPLPSARQQEELSKMAAGMQSGMPPRENPRINTSVDSVHASGPLGRAHCVIHGNCNYKQTGLLQAYFAYHLIQAPARRYGFTSACQAFGHRQLLGALQSFGLVGRPHLQLNAGGAG
jgi:short subunit dehydrogenase-like uncharacterized protein